jgi:hypothetical protein
MFVISGLEITASQLSVKMTSKISFSLVIPCFWVNVTGQNDRQGKDLTGQVQIMAGHCLMTGHYFKPCFSKLQKKCRTQLYYQYINI